MSMYPYNNIEQGPNFDRARQLISTPFQYVDVALDQAGVNVILNISGDFLYLDASSTGVVTIELNNQYNDASAPFLAQPGFGLNALFKQVKLNWSAQQNKKVRIMYSTGDRVVPTNATTINGTVGISGAVETIGYGGKNVISFSMSNELVANTPITVFNPAENVNGAVIVRAAFVNMSMQVNIYYDCVLLAKNSTPTNSRDGLVIMQADSMSFISGYSNLSAKLENPIYIPKGMGAYFVSSVGTQGNKALCLYDLL